VVDNARLLQPATALGIEPPQEARIGRHLRLKDHRRQFRHLRRWQKQPIEAIFPLLEHRCREAVTGS
jgi:hypothetical protein